MTQGKLAVVVLAAGLGTRMKSKLPKVMHPIAGRPMITHLLETVSQLAPERVAVVIGPDMDQLAACVAPHATVVQYERLGTGHAVSCACDVLEGFDGDVLVLYGDTPLITAETLNRMLDLRCGANHPAVVVLGFRPEDGGEYGRLVVSGEGSLELIVEHREATPAQRALPLCNSGVMCIAGEHLPSLLDRLSNENAKGEYYLTDIVALARADGLACGYVEGATDELIGVNSRQELAVAERILQTRLRRRAMAGGATLQDPDSVYFSSDTVLGHDVVIGPNVVFGPEVTVGDDVEIRAFCHIEGTIIAPGALIGPFARLRPGAEIGAAAHIGNFVEIKNSKVEDGAKINHLAYVGDARVGAKANVGAGTITCNYDGFNKSLTDIGVGAFIGSNSALVAPVKIGDGAVIGAGSVIIRDVAPNALAVARGTQMELAGWVDRFRARKRAEKQEKSKG